MRAIGQLPDQPSAKRFSDFLLVQGVANQIEPDDNGHWTLWVHEDDQVSQAQALLAEFSRQPADPKYRQAGSSAREIRDREQQETQAWRKRFLDGASLWRAGQRRPGWLTSALVGICLLVGLLLWLQGLDAPVSHALSISDYRSDGDLIYYTPFLPEVRSGQFWRLVTPIFLHFDALHLIFNMFWLLDLGSMIEARQSPLRLAAKVVLIAAVSNLAQYFAGGPAFSLGGPRFGGMSGVIYGLFGYIWMRGKFDPRSGFHLDPASVTILVVWFFVCLTPLMGSVANMAHAAGLALGLIWGLLAAKLNR